MTTPAQPLRKTTQDLLPLCQPPRAVGYDLWPSHPLGAGRIHTDWAPLAAALDGQRLLKLDGFGGVFFEELRAGLAAALQARGRRVRWVSTEAYFRAESEIEALVAPFVGTDPVWGTAFGGRLMEFFRGGTLQALRPTAEDDLLVVYGCGAGLCGGLGLLAYADVPKNEIQFRARAASVANLGRRQPLDAKTAYKRCYFVDWPVLNTHKASLLPLIDWVIDAQRPGQPTLARGEDLRQGLRALAGSSFRVRPWFEPGVWGGQWCKDVVPQLPRDVPNYAWSFELIVPENGLVFESDGALLEVSFDCLMFQEGARVLGPEGHERFGAEFPIRFDFLDTVDGGNLSLQCHPRPGYVRQQFGERFTQDETYYMLDAKPGACVYLGFQEDIDPAAYRAALEANQKDGRSLDVERFVQKHPAAKHDLFLIPNGAVHCSGKDGVVLEISATPYIFTFKMHDWGRLDLDGKPRPINIDRAFANLRFELRGERARRELLAQPRQVPSGPEQRRYELPTHPRHFYAIERHEFEDAIDIPTDGGVQVFSLVEGSRLEVITADGTTRDYRYAETFVVAAAAGSVRLRNLGGGTAKVVRSFLKPGWVLPPDEDVGA